MSIDADGSPTEGREEELRRALEAALGSLSALGGIYEQREMRWVEEMRRLDEDREKVQMLLSQMLGVGMGGINGMGGMGMGMGGGGMGFGGMGMPGMGGVSMGRGGGMNTAGATGGEKNGVSAVSEGGSPKLKAPKPSVPI